MKTIISGIQQIGIGVPDVYEAWAWYRKYFGMNIPVFDEAAEAGLMLPYTGGKPQKRHAVLAINIQGGGGFEIWQYTERKPQKPVFDIKLGDLGIYITKIKTRDINKAYDYYKSLNADLVSEIVKDPKGNEHFFIRDPYNNLFQVVSHKHSWFVKRKMVTGGPNGCIIGVSDIENARKVYSDILGYDEVVYDIEGVFEDFANIPGGKNKVRRVLLKHSEPRQGGFSRLFGTTTIELISVQDRTPEKIYKDRFWGDYGFIHLCFDIHGMDKMRKECAEKGFNFTVDSSKSFDMGEAAGHFSYIEDPDGALIEFVETHKIPVLKKIGWYLNLKKRNPEKPLPDWMIKTMELSSHKN
ncbi:MAG: VOC family protein [Chlorobi bacterium]|nr:VOC family protein [Chlorobiota bacterium]